MDVKFLYAQHTFAWSVKQVGDICPSLSVDLNHFRLAQLLYIPALVLASLPPASPSS